VHADPQHAASDPKIGGLRTLDDRRFATLLLALFIVINARFTDAVNRLAAIYFARKNG